MSLEHYFLDFMDILTMVAIGTGLSLCIVALFFVPLIKWHNRVHNK